MKEFESDEYWVSLGDMMSGLMMVFLFIAVLYMLDAQNKQSRAEKSREDTIQSASVSELERRKAENAREQLQLIAKAFYDTGDQLYNALFTEFKDDLPRWGATLERKTLSIRFNEPDLLFEQGSDELRPQFRSILQDFFPRYVKILIDYSKEIEEVRIEGHTSSEWRDGSSDLAAYFQNMKLSQDRTRSTLAYLLGLTEVASFNDWLKGRLTANGLSSSHPVMVEGGENMELSRRVEFRVRVNAEKRLEEIILRSVVAQ